MAAQRPCRQRGSKLTSLIIGIFYNSILIRNKVITQKFKKWFETNFWIILSLRITYVWMLLGYGLGLNRIAAGRIHNWITPSLKWLPKENDVPLPTPKTPYKKTRSKVFVQINNSKWFRVKKPHIINLRFILFTQFVYLTFIFRKSVFTDHLYKSTRSKPLLDILTI